MNETASLSITLPILFLVILQLCDAARDIDLTSISEEDVWNIELSSKNIPASPFGLIHIVNYLSIVAILVGLTDLYSNSIFTGVWNADADPVLYLVLIAFGILVLLPILEVQNYGRARPAGGYPIPISFLMHLIGVATSLVAIVLGERVRQARPDVDTIWEIPIRVIETFQSSPELAVYDILTFIFSTISGLCAIAFIGLVHSEMSELNIE